ncbi:MAG: hypothetical protein JWQ11_2960, partial [Rhizobacter sp.]|nr:hypothetical protein [Rhizobacter sp.]
SALLFGLAAWFPRLGAAEAPVGFLAYAGYAAYLFHRPIYMLLIGSYLPESPGLQIAYILFVCVPIIFVVATVIQRLFDRAFVFVAGRSTRTATSAQAEK